MVKGKGVIMFRTEKKKYIITMLLISVACVFLFAGCQSGGAEDLYLSKVSYVVCPVDGQDIDMTCQFCGKSYHFTLDDIRKIRPRTFGAGGQDAQA